MTAFLAAAIAILSGIWSATVVSDSGIEATWRYDGFRGEYVVTHNYTPPPVVPEAPASGPSGPGIDGMYGTVARYFPEQPDFAWGVCLCESDLDGDGQPDANVIAKTRRGAAGEEGAFQVLARYHGYVPDTFEGQVAQARAIYLRSGWAPWSCRDTRLWR